MPRRSPRSWWRSSCRFWGVLADYAGNKIKFFIGFFLTGLVLCFAQAVPMSAMAFLVIYVVCTVGLNSSMTFYDAMLPDITTDERMDAVSSSGYAWGYIGSTIPFIICLALIKRPFGARSRDDVLHAHGLCHHRHVVARIHPAPATYL